MSTEISPLIYDAVSLLGFGPPSDVLLPEPTSDDTFIHYGGWSLQELRDSLIGQQLMLQEDWYNEYTWSNRQLASGIYRLRVPVPNSNRKSFVEQEQSLHAGEHAAPLVLVATALLAHRLQTKEDLLEEGWTRCKEQAAAGRRVVLYWDYGRLSIDYDGLDDRRFDNVWLSSVWTS
jgi:hypothetical protein